MREFADRHPGWVALSVWGLFLLVMMLGQRVSQLVNPWWVIVGEYALLVGLAVPAVAALGGWREVGFGPFRSKGDWRLCLVPMAVPLLYLGAGGWAVTDPLVLAELGGLALLTGLLEELYFRGLIQRCLQRFGVGWAVFGTATVFAGTHLVNMAAGQSLFSTSLQLLYTFLFGLCLGLLRMRTGVIWPLMVIHAFNNFLTGAASPGIRDAFLWFVILCAIATVYGIFSAWLWGRLEAERAEQAMRERAAL